MDVAIKLEDGADIKMENPEDGISSKGLKTKLIVNYLPQGMSDMEFKQLFESIGALDSFRVMRDRGTGYSFGYGFVDFHEVEDAKAAIDKLNGHQLGHKTLRVAYSKPPGSAKNTNLHVTGLGTNCDEAKLEGLFAPHGDIVQVKVLRNADGSSKGAGFVLFKLKKDADVAIRALQGYADGYGMNLQIHYAKDNSEQQRIHPKYQEFINQKFMEQSQAFVNGGNYATPEYANATYGANFNQNGSYGGGYGMQVDYNNMQGAQKVGRVGSTRFNPIARPIPGIAANPSLQGTPSIILYIYNIGPTATEGDLYALFSRFGRITKVNVIDGKGYGFVHMPVPYEASDAVRNLNGMLYNGKVLQVSVKTNKK